jgi:hypothetical protein
VIHEVDDALRRLIRDETLNGSPVDVALEAPTKDWAARRNAPVVNLYLYDIREDVRRRQRGLIEEHGAGGQVIARRPLPRFIKLSYLVTAWTQRPEDEHRLLSTLLAGLLRWEAVPARLLGGSLAALGLPVPMTVALPPPEDRSFADVWTALGGELKPSLDLLVSAPIEAGGLAAAGPPVTDGLWIDLSSTDRRDAASAGQRDAAGAGQQDAAGAGRRDGVSERIGQPAPERVAMRRPRS